MSLVTLTIGIPASGKSTWAKAEAAQTGAVIVCRDDIRIMQGLKHGEDEDRVTRAANSMLDGAILDGYDVIVADTNLNPKFRNRLVKFCHQRGADVQFKVFPISLDEAIRRDFKRALEHKPSVGPDVITKFYNQFVQQNPTDQLLPVPSFAPYEHRDRGTTQDAICVDIDGTVARHVNRSPYDYSKVSDDEPIIDVLQIVNSLSYNYMVVFVSGRDDSCQEATQAWLEDYLPRHTFKLLMRKTGDQRPDYVIKNEIYDEHIIPNYNVVMVFDDRDQVVHHLRRRGITVAQVAPGRF